MLPDYRYHLVEISFKNKREVFSGVVLSQENDVLRLADQHSRTVRPINTKDAQIKTLKVLGPDIRHWPCHSSTALALARVSWGTSATIRLVRKNMPDTLVKPVIRLNEWLQALTDADNGS